MFLTLKIANLRSQREDEICDQANRYSKKWLTGTCKILGIHIKVTGEEPSPGTLIAPNHLGYSDIFAIGATTPCTFLTTTEIASWPVIGSLINVTGQIPMVRFAKGRELVSTSRKIRDRLSQRNSVCVFLEGTSTGGDGVLPFFSPLLQSAIDAKKKVVPTAIRWLTEDARVEVSESIAYWKDHRFVPHFWGFLGLREVICQIHFGEPVIADGWHRKPLAAHVHDRVVKLLGASKPTQAYLTEEVAVPPTPRARRIVRASSA